ncbi:hypothetical protein EIN_397350 [Entamoeba invadens IP1]|uniref:Uncharacterized protein n=1 Tax=Entamoeba invadens IP1 TaxID=370355 RepID=A0A0A1UA47_ENTIV|nr:hypothetical protein EIN_397350 [Entamoeba invadens IP1]ELP91855.1 hypothetical protein EIN_397350 [Entamoeba invadens IP1]|eukprot:XP_004258626.1 hypothetical protein EIN_397350 [Entamoeba invadens IP1]
MKGRELSPPKVKYSYKKIRDGHVANESVIIALLSQFADVTVHKPFGKSLVSLPFIPVETIKFQKDDYIDVELFIERRLKERKIFDIQNGIDEKTADRRIKKYRIPTTVVFLSDLLNEFGVISISTQTCGKNKACVVYYINTIVTSFGIFTKDKLVEIGRKINEELVLRTLKINERTTIHKGDVVMARLLGM